jgi:hypothetical protein
MRSSTSRRPGRSTTVQGAGSWRRGRRRSRRHRVGSGRVAPMTLDTNHSRVGGLLARSTDADGSELRANHAPRAGATPDSACLAGETGG